MSDLLTLTGSITIARTYGEQSGAIGYSTELDEKTGLGLPGKHGDSVSLTVDTPVVVSLGGLTGANFVMLRATGGKVKARFTSSDGTTQALPVDPLLILKCDSVDITAIDLTRIAGTPTTVEVLLGEKA
jgi:hypothetical protein